ncbi:MAG: hypothetical protein GY913_32080 [Proteobacteria bacterium]|nr:hypothetical protein [Pseudomonadota bacterium]MCP4921560.1 hypothetical protein [Pseudomonadota bacterium]
MIWKKTLHALTALAICSIGYLGPWWLGMFKPTVSVVHVEPEPIREVRLVVVPPPQLEAEVDEAIEVADAEPEIVPEVPDAPEGLEPILVASEGTVEGPALPVVTVDVDLGPVGMAVAKAPAAKRERTSVRRSSRRPVSTCLPDRDDIAEVAETAYRVEDGLVYYYANHIPEASELAASWWNRDDEGERYGFKIGRMKCGSLLRQMGFKNGDVIMGVNGHEIRSYTDGVTAFMRLRAKRILWVDVLRRGEPVRIDFVLVDEGEALAEYDSADPLADPTALVDHELELAELPWLERRFEKGKDRRAERKSRRERG